jgi:hypothetical protein
MPFKAAAAGEKRSGGRRVHKQADSAACGRSVASLSRQPRILAAAPIRRCKILCSVKAFAAPKRQKNGGKHCREWHPSFHPPPADRHGPKPPAPPRRPAPRRRLRCDAQTICISLKVRYHGITHRARVGGGLGPAPPAGCAPSPAPATARPRICGADCSQMIFAFRVHPPPPACPRLGRAVGAVVGLPL